MKFDIKNMVSRGIGTTKLAAKKYGPTVLFVGGTALLVAAVGQAIVDTIRGGKDIVDNYKADLEDIDFRLTSEDDESKITADQAKQEKNALQMNTGKKLVLNYKKTGLMVAAGITMTAAGYSLKCGQLKDTAAALATTAGSFFSYRQNVRESLGKDKDLEFMYGIKKENVEVVDMNEDGTTTAREETVTKVEEPDGKAIAGYSKYARFFDESCSEWEKDANYNLAYLTARQAEANSRLKRDGYLFLNDVYDMLGIPRTKEGAIVGWRYLKNNPVGDNQVDFGIHRIDSCAGRRFVNGYEPVILLDFNVDGDILNTFPYGELKKSA